MTETHVAVSIKYHTNIPHIEKIPIGDWIDLRASETVILREGEAKLIPLGVSMRLPEGYEAIVAPRSSTFKNYGIIMTNSIGVIDNSFSGTNNIWRFPAYCLETKDIIDGVPATRITKGDRICQFRIQKRQPSIEFVEVDELGADRGSFGSTGVK